MSNEYRLHFIYVMMAMVIMASFICCLKEFGIIPNGYMEFSPEAYEMFDEYKWNISKERYDIIDIWHTEEPSLLNRQERFYYHICIDNDYVISVCLPSGIPFNTPFDLTGEISGMKKSLAAAEGDEILEQYDQVYEAIIYPDHKSGFKKTLSAISYLLGGCIVSYLLLHALRRQHMLKTNEDYDEI